MRFFLISPFKIISGHVISHFDIGSFSSFDDDVQSGFLIFLVFHMHRIWSKEIFCNRYLIVWWMIGLNLQKLWVFSVFFLYRRKPFKFRFFFWPLFDFLIAILSLNCQTVSVNLTNEKCKQKGENEKMVDWKVPRYTLFAAQLNRCAKC